MGSGHRLLIPVCALAGGLLVLIADTVARTVIEPSEIPTGIVVSLLGAPYFVFLLLKERKNTVKG
ncbi:iron chelate uptake ABC transporter family permease subunit [Anaerocolumna jejuensis]|uniref:iron chelate uptake ABC transporter family permease subunit n=1 Tax=Anaerocolumna jejuensis TaxID=259063 RepID=UPI001FA93189|nr:iron chelate uptake ABC transporter family permease subunit [Anaerocolumna jejuensis]